MRGRPKICCVIQSADTGASNALIVSKSQSFLIDCTAALWNNTTSIKTRGMNKVNNKEDFKILTWDEVDNQFWWYTLTEWENYKEPGEIQLNDYLPLTEGSGELLKMLYPDFPFSLMRKALLCWDSYFDRRFVDGYYYYDEEAGIWR